MTVQVRLSAPLQTGPVAHQASCTTHTLFFPGVTWLGRGVADPPQSSAKVKERVELYAYSPSEPSWPVLGSTLPPPLSHFQSAACLAKIWITEQGWHPRREAKYCTLIHSSPGSRSVMWNNKDTAPFFHQYCHMDCHMIESSLLQ
jgi:hypothetical protein